MNLFRRIGFVGDPLRFQMCRALSFYYSRRTMTTALSPPSSQFSHRKAGNLLWLAHFVSYLWPFGVSHKCFIGIVLYWFIYAKYTRHGRWWVEKERERDKMKRTHLICTTFFGLYHSWQNSLYPSIPFACAFFLATENLTNKSFTEKSWAIKSVQRPTRAPQETQK